MIEKLREAIGQPSTRETFSDQNYFEEQPDWFAPERIVLSIDEDKLEENNRMTLTMIVKEAKNLKKGEIIELLTSFLPAPGIDILKSKGYSVWSKKEGDDLIKSYFLKNTN